MAKVNKLSSGAIKSAYSKEFTQKKVIISVSGKDYEILVDEKFKRTKLSKMIVEGIKNQKDLPEDENIRISYYLFLMLKYFTDMDIETEDLTEQLSLLNNMIDLGIFEKLTEAIPVEEMNKASEFIKQMGEKIKEMSEQNKSKEEIENAIENEID
jgi:hypothetical protein